MKTDPVAVKLNKTNENSYTFSREDNIQFYNNATKQLKVLESKSIDGTKDSLGFSTGTVDQPTVDPTPTPTPTPAAP